MRCRASRRALATLGLTCVALVAACTDDGSSDDAGGTATHPSTTDTASSSAMSSPTTTTAVPSASLVDRAFRDLESFGYAELAPDELLLFAGGVEADVTSDVIRGVDARAVGNPGEPIGVLVAYDLGPAFQDPAAWARFAAGVAIGANTSPLDIEVDGTPATLIVDIAADTIGILWRADEHLGLLAIAEDGTEAFRIASERIAAS